MKRSIAAVAALALLIALFAWGCSSVEPAENYGNDSYSNNTPTQRATQAPRKTSLELVADAIVQNHKEYSNGIYMYHTTTTSLGVSSSSLNSGGGNFVASYGSAVILAYTVKMDDGDITIYVTVTDQNGRYKYRTISEVGGLKCTMDGFFDRSSLNSQNSFTYDTCDYPTLASSMKAMAYMAANDLVTCFSAFLTSFNCGSLSDYNL